MKGRDNVIAVLLTLRESSRPGNVWKMFFFVSIIFIPRDTESKSDIEQNKERARKRKRENIVGLEPLEHPVRCLSFRIRLLLPSFRHSRTDQELARNGHGPCRCIRWRTINTQIMLVYEPPHRLTTRMVCWVLVRNLGSVLASGNETAKSRKRLPQDRAAMDGWVMTW